MSTISDFLDSLTFAQDDLPYVNKQLILGSLFWAESPPPAFNPDNEDEPKQFYVYDYKTEQVIGWDLGDINLMIRQVAVSASNGSPARVTISKMIDDSVMTEPLKAYYVDQELGNIMLQFWAFNQVKY